MVIITFMIYIALDDIITSKILHVQLYRLKKILQVYTKSTEFLQAHLYYIISLRSQDDL